MYPPPKKLNHFLKKIIPHPLKKLEHPDNETLLIGKNLNPMKEVTFNDNIKKISTPPEKNLNPPKKISTAPCNFSTTPTPKNFSPPPPNIFQPPLRKFFSLFG